MYLSSDHSLVAKAFTNNAWWAPVREKVSKGNNRPSRTLTHWAVDTYPENKQPKSLQTTRSHSGTVNSKQNHNETVSRHLWTPEATLVVSQELLGNVKCKPRKRPEKEQSTHISAVTQFSNVRIKCARIRKSRRHAIKKCTMNRQEQQVNCQKFRTREAVFPINLVSFMCKNVCRN
jgi:hypothetical protein